jgi:TonB family protein
MAWSQVSAETVVGLDDRIPSLSCFRSSGPGNTKLDCELVNSTSDKFFVVRSDAGKPQALIDRLLHGRWQNADAEVGSDKLQLGPGETIGFAAHISGPPAPIRVRVTVYRSGSANPISIVGGPLRFAADPTVDDIPTVLCADVSPPALVDKVMPVYPDVAKHAGISGTVVLEVVVARDGKIQDARVIQSVPVLDSAAVEAVRKWRYRPARDRSGRPLAVYFRISVRFELPTAAGTSPDSYEVARAAVLAQVISKLHG